ncbi:MAG: ParB/RepB/Spo0J family partition protein [Bacillota bacterium]|nr:ParB/RepB/Spo0J family partition protein [Bacillota bacterium]
MQAISPNPYQPRKHFDEEKLEELAASIKEHGVLQPLLVRRVGSGYQLIAGERRWRAAQRAGLAEVPVLVRELDEATMMKIALVENLQREDLNPLEEAEAYQRLLQEFKMTQEEIAGAVGKSRSAIANALRLLNLPPEIQASLAEGKITAGHARALLSLGDEEAQLAAWRKVLEQGLTVREVEALAGSPRSSRGKPASRRPQPPPVEPELQEVARRLEEFLGTRVIIKPGKEKGCLEIEYYGLEDLERLVELILG